MILIRKSELKTDKRIHKISIVLYMSGGSKRICKVDIMSKTLIFAAKAKQSVYFKNFISLI